MRYKILRMIPRRTTPESVVFVAAGFTLLELLFATLIVTITFSTLLNYQQWLQQQILHLEWQQQAWQLAHYSLEAARAHHGSPVDIPQLPSKQWRRAWQITAAMHPCHRITVTVVGPGAIAAQLTQQWCPLPQP